MLYEQAEELDHVGPPIGHDLEDHKTEVLEDCDKEWVQQEPHSELEIELRQSYIPDWRNMRPLQISRFDHLKTIHPRYPCAFLRYGRRFKVAAANRDLLHLVIDLTTRSEHNLLRRLYGLSSLMTRCDLRCRLSVRGTGRRDIPIQGITRHRSKRSPRNSPSSTAPLARHLQIKNRVSMSTF